MSRRYPPGRRNDDEDVASGDVSRFLVAGFLIAGSLGLVIGIGWVVWNLL